MIIADTASSHSSATPNPLPTVSGIFCGLREKLALSVRHSQTELAGLVRETLHKGKGSICCVQAPTGTGKTLGYLAGALDAQARSQEPLPIVIATATVGLQSQILVHDIPRLADIGALDPKRVVLAKGRGRYFCPHTAEMLQDKKIDSQYDLFDAGKDVTQGGVPIALDMLHAWKEKRWDGDRDNWTGAIPECWDDYCAANAQTCVNKACAHRQECPYMKSRTKISKAQVIVANHDIVLSDLKVRKEEGDRTVLPVKTYSLIVDEAHNLPSKAVDMQKSQANLCQTDWLQDLAPYSEAISHLDDLTAALARLDGVPKDVFGRHAAELLRHIEKMQGTLLSSSFRYDNVGVYSWGLRRPSAALTADALEIESRLTGIIKALKRSAAYFMEAAQESSGSVKGRCLRRLSETNSFLKHASALQEGLSAFRSEDELVRWVKRHDNGGVVLNVQPLEGDQVLRDLLWNTEIPVAMVSATLGIAGSFEHFARKSGLPAHAVTRMLPAVFDYSRGLLHQPSMTHEPGAQGYEAELADKLERIFAKKVAAGMLVLFTSRESMLRVASKLSDAMKMCLQVQGSAPLPEITKTHRARIDAGNRSVLFGLNSMSEGLDLPGDYCNHVVITKLPFAVPTDPVEAARQEALGDKWFNTSYLADMLTALIQSCGRLLRRELDHGVVTILDKRLQTKRYGSRSLAALPTFTRGRYLKSYFALAEERGFKVCETRVLERLSQTVPAQATPATLDIDRLLAEAVRHARANPPTKAECAAFARNLAIAIAEVQEDLANSRFVRCPVSGQYQLVPLKPISRDAEPRPANHSQRNNASSIAMSEQSLYGLGLPEAGSVSQLSGGSRAEPTSAAGAESIARSAVISAGRLKEPGLGDICLQEHERKKHDRDDLRSVSYLSAKAMTYDNEYDPKFQALMSKLTSIDPAYHASQPSYEEVGHLMPG